MGINDNGFIRGLVGPLVNRKVGNKNYLQSRPYRVKQTDDTKRAGKDFGKVSRAGALIRMCFGEVHQDLHDGQMGNRLNRQIYRAIKTNLDCEKGNRTLSNCVLDRLVNFQFNENCHMQDYLFIDPVISLNKRKDLKISFPQFDIKRALVLPEKCNAVVFKFKALSFDFDELGPIEINDVEWEYDIKYREQAISEKTLTVKCGDFVGTSIFVGFTMLYLEKDSRRSNVLNKIDFNPASILAAFQLY
ncbi:hypothetical protein OHD16_11255 [Sphingobacterium sp. ML3W]|uniref:hypothetical protein n=1 Tax=Sphingobacterium sp. ML3W TaxID=1538644 RepID=UPI00249A8D00|nr:hypothetical protein [Sphingobacterium sp. ML3W]WFA80541.1 hypothetical protein OGI71_04400 [Sphingobacterium sp. ML3W]